MLTSTEAEARGLVTLPVAAPLSNQYFLMRAGESISDSLGLVKTNPVDKLSKGNSLTPAGQQQAEAAADALVEAGITMPLIWFSTTEKCIRTADIIGDKLLVAMENRKCEYSYLDARGVGLFEGLEFDPSTEARLRTIDQRDAREKPPPTEDGTPNESLDNVKTRVNQMLSIMETLATGMDIIVVAPDSDVLTVWQAAVAGAPLEGHTAFAMAPGEMRGLEYPLPVGYDGVSLPPVLNPLPQPEGSMKLPERMALAKSLHEKARSRTASLSASAIEAERTTLVTDLTMAKSRVEAEDKIAYDEEQATLKGKLEEKQEAQRKLALEKQEQRQQLALEKQETFIAEKQKRDEKRYVTTEKHNRYTAEKAEKRGGRVVGANERKQQPRKDMTPEEIKGRDQFGLAALALVAGAVGLGGGSSGGQPREEQYAALATDAKEFSPRDAANNIREEESLVVASQVREETVGGGRDGGSVHSKNQMQSIQDSLQEEEKTLDPEADMRRAMNAVAAESNKADLSIEEAVRLLENPLAGSNRNHDDDSLTNDRPEENQWTEDWLSLAKSIKKEDATTASW